MPLNIADFAGVDRGWSHFTGEFRQARIVAQALYWGKCIKLMHR
jgi:hypothetical protein